MENEKKVLVIVPAYNESENLHIVEKDLKENFKEADILFINDHSTDNTLEIIKSFDNVHYIDLPVNLGYFFAIQSGLKYANQYGYDYVVQFDGDGQHLAKEAKRMYDYAREKDLDLLIGSRYLEELGFKQSFFRKLGTKIFQKMIKTLTKKEITDPTSGLQVLKRPVFEYLSQIYNYPETADANLLMDLIYQDFNIEELAVEMKNRETGESMHGGIVKPAKYMSKMFYYIFIIYLDNLFGSRKRKKS